MADASAAAHKEYVTGNNDADGVVPAAVGARAGSRAGRTHLRAQLVAWGGNASGVNVANIDNLGHVHPDTMWWHHDAGQRARAAVLGDLGRHLRRR